jgi:hypothetical protein
VDKSGLELKAWELYYSGYLNKIEGNFFFRNALFLLRISCSMNLGNTSKSTCKVIPLKLWGEKSHILFIKLI